MAPRGPASVRPYSLRTLCLRAALLALGVTTLQLLALPGAEAAAGAARPRMVPARRAGSSRSGCRCVPDQWEGTLSSTERELGEGDSAQLLEGRIRVSYDFVNARFAMTDLATGRRAVDDYGKGQKYIVSGHGCFQLDSRDEMTRMCLPDHAEFLGDFRLGTDLAVGMWQLVSEHNSTMRTTILQSNCVPVSEEIYMAKHGYASLTSSLYLDVSLGIADTRVFAPPEHCAPAPPPSSELDEYDIDPLQGYGHQVKRSALSYTEAIRQHFLLQ